MALRKGCRYCFRCFFPTMNTKPIDNVALFSKNSTSAERRNKLPNQRRSKAKHSRFTYYHWKLNCFTIHIITKIRFFNFYSVFTGCLLTNIQSHFKLNLLLIRVWVKTGPILQKIICTEKIFFSRKCSKLSFVLSYFKKCWILHGFHLHQHNLERIHEKSMKLVVL